MYTFQYWSARFQQSPFQIEHYRFMIWRLHHSNTTPKMFAGAHPSLVGGSIQPSREGYQSNPPTFSPVYQQEDASHAMMGQHVNYCGACLEVLVFLFPRWDYSQLLLTSYQPASQKFPAFLIWSPGSLDTEPLHHSKVIVLGGNLYKSICKDIKVEINCEEIK